MGLTLGLCDCSEEWPSLGDDGELVTVEARGGA